MEVAQTSKGPMWARIILLVLAAALALGWFMARSPAPAPAARPTARPAVTSGVCQDVAASGQAMAEMQTILKGLDVSSRTKLKEDARQVRAIINTYGASSGTEETKELRIWVSGAMDAIAQMLEAWSAGESGETYAAIHQRLVKSAGDKAAELRAEHHCP